MIPETIFGWIKQKPDPRDYTVKFNLLPGKPAKLPASCDLRSKCPPIENQGQHGTCTQFAYCGVASFMENKQGHGFQAFSENFGYYKTVHDIEGENPLNDPGATIRDTMDAAKKFGTCFSKTWPYDEAHFGKKPNAVAIAEALRYQLISYAALDKIGTSPATILTNVKTMVASGFPAEFGFRVLKSFMSIGANGLMPYPKAGEEELGGHAVVAVGYNDAIKCPNASKGALLIRNSWGTDWGLEGYFWMPYDCIIKPYDGERLAEDFWTEGSIEWMNKGV